MKKLLIRILGLNTKNNYCEESSEVVQKFRKQNLVNFISNYYSGNIEDLAKILNKHPNYINALLKNMGETNSRAITTKMARLIESHLNIKSGILDEESPSSFMRHYVPVIDGVNTINSQSLMLSTSKPNEYLDPECHTAFHMLILDTSEFDSIHITVDGKMGILQTKEKVLIDRESDNEIILFLGDESFMFNGRVINYKAQAN